MTIIAIILTILTLLVVILMSKLDHLGEQLNKLYARLYGETEEDFGEYRLDGDIDVIKTIIDEQYSTLCERMDAKFVEKPIKKLKVK